MCVFSTTKVVCYITVEEVIVSNTYVQRNRYYFVLYSQSSFNLKVKYIIFRSWFGFEKKSNVLQYFRKLFLHFILAVQLFVSTDNQHDYVIGGNFKGEFAAGIKRHIRIQFVYAPDPNLSDMIIFTGISYLDLPCIYRLTKIYRPLYSSCSRPSTRVAKTGRRTLRMPRPGGLAYLLITPEWHVRKTRGRNVADVDTVAVKMSFAGMAYVSYACTSAMWIKHDYGMSPISTLPL